MNESVEIVRLAGGGDGVTEEGAFIPYTVPGDVVRIEGGSNARVAEIIKPGPSRVGAKCRHFGRCGGCSLQHVAQHVYLGWKRDLVATALARRGFENVDVEDVRAVGPGTRRRADLKAYRTESGVALGFFERQSRDLVDVSECPVLVSEITEAIPALRGGVEKLLRSGESARLHVTLTHAGLDVSLKWKRSRGPDTLFALAEFAREAKLARLSWNGEPVAVARAPYLEIGRHSVILPVEPFLQPTSEGEAILQSLVRDWVEGAHHVADLFSGCGTFALALDETCSVVAVEEDAAMADALEDAAKEKNSKVAVERRDLFRRPLLPPELSRYDTVILDPPRPGAKRQAEQLARADVKRIVYVSCNPSSFARDARILRDGGYQLRRVVPIDQFLWSAHVELVAFFDYSTNR